MPRRIRNYRAMRDEKLVDCLRSLDDRSGEPYDRCLLSGSGDPSRDARVIRQIVNERLADSAAAFLSNH